MTSPKKTTGPEDTFIISQENPEATSPGKAEIAIGLLQTRIVLLCALASSVVFVVNSSTDRNEDCSFPENHGQRAPNVWRSMTLLLCATQSSSVSAAGPAALV